MKHPMPRTRGRPSSPCPPRPTSSPRRPSRRCSTSCATTISTRPSLFTPETGGGPGVIVIQEWWGVDPSLLQNAERLSKAGFAVLVPDLYHGELAQHDEMDKAAQLMSSMPADRAARDMSGAVDYLAG